jgi:hypothetical protein
MQRKNKLETELAEGQRDVARHEESRRAFAAEFEVALGEADATRQLQEEEERALAADKSSLGQVLESVTAAWRRIKLYEDAGKAAELAAAQRRLAETSARKAEWQAKLEACEADLQVCIPYLTPLCIPYLTSRIRRTCRATTSC